MTLMMRWLKIRKTDLNLLEGRLRHEEFKKALLQSINEYYIYVDQ